MKKKLAILPLTLLGLLVVSCNNSNNVPLNDKTDGFDQLAGAIWSKADSLSVGDIVLLSSDIYSPTHELSNGKLEGKEAKYGRVDTDQDFLQLSVKRYGDGSYRFYNKDGNYLANNGGNIDFERGDSYWNLIPANNDHFTFKSSKSNAYLTYNTLESQFEISTKEASLKVYKGVYETFIYPTSLTIEGQNEVPLYEDVALEVKYTPSDVTEKEVIWTSSDESVASISDDGIVTARKMGDTTITCVSAYDNKIVAQHALHVGPERVRVTGIETPRQDYAIYIGEDASKIEASVVPSNATNKLIHYSVEDESIASIDQDGMITAINEGSTAVIVTTDDGGYRDTIDVRVFKNRKGYEEWRLLDDMSKLKDINEVVIANADKGLVAGNLTSTYLSRVTGSIFTSDKEYIEALDDKANRFILTRDSEGYYYFKNSNAETLGAKNVKNLAYGEGQDKWMISLSGYNAVISSYETSYGSIQYSSGTRSNRFSNYTTSENAVQLYVNNLFTPVYPESITINGDSEVSIDSSTYYSVGFEPQTTNMKKITWTTSDSNVATIDNRGKLTAVKEGQVQVIATGYNADNEPVTATKDITVKHIEVTGLSLNFSSKQVAVNKKFTITPIIEPSNATYQDVTYESENTKIATVDSKGVVHGVSEGQTRIVVTTVDGGYQATVDVDVVTTISAKWTIMIYLCGADLESGSGLATMDIDEILKVNNQPDNVNIIIETGGARSWRTKYGVSAQYLQRWHVENKSLIRDESITRQSMGKPETLSSFVEWGLTKYPADKVGLILWNHGGAMQGVCYDENYNDDNLLNSEVSSAMSTVFTRMGLSEKLEWIGYDACLMAVQDIAQTNSKYFNYMVSSEESESGEGWDYDTWVDDLYALKSTETILKAIVDGFIAYNGSGSDQTLSVMNLKKMDDYFTAWENMSAALINKINSSNRGSFNNLVKSAESYTYSTSSYGIFDAKDFIDKLANNSTFNPGSSYISAVKSAFSNFMTYSKCGTRAGNSYGVCLYWAASSGCYKSYYYTENQTNFVNWRKIVTTYGY